MLAAPETKSEPGELWLTPLLVTSKPFVLSHFGFVDGIAASGPQRYHVRVPAQVGLPLIVRLAVSVPDETTPVPMLTGDVAFSCVERLEVHSPSLLVTKSNSVELG